MGGNTIGNFNPYAMDTAKYKGVDYSKFNLNDSIYEQVPPTAPMPNDQVSFSGGQKKEGEEEKGSSIGKWLLGAAVIAGGVLAYKKIPAVKKFVQSIIDRFSPAKAHKTKIKQAIKTQNQAAKTNRSNFSKNFEDELARGKSKSDLIKEQMMNPGKYVVEDLRKVKPGEQYSIPFVFE